ncbi:MAG: acyl-CoA thioesterase [Halobacteriaceae archaeon]
MPTLLGTRVENRQFVYPQHANNHGTVHGGQVMRWMDEGGAMAAIRFAGKPCVTASVDGLDFHHPVPVGQILVVEAYVYDTGRTSMSVHLRADRENPRTGERERTTESDFVFVAVGEDGKPTPVPDLTVETDEGEALRADARGE